MRTSTAGTTCRSWFNWKTLHKLELKRQKYPINKKIKKTQIKCKVGTAHPGDEERRGIWTWSPSLLFSIRNVFPRKGSLIKSCDAFDRRVCGASQTESRCGRHSCLRVSCLDFKVCFYSFSLSHTRTLLLHLSLSFSDPSPHLLLYPLCMKLDWLDENKQMHVNSFWSEWTKMLKYPWTGIETASEEIICVL